MSFTTDKTVLRARMRALRRQLAKARPDAAERLWSHLPPRWVEEGFEVGAYALYHPVGAEIDPSGLGFPGGVAALPVTVSPDAPLIFRIHAPQRPLVPDVLGIPAPGPDCPEVLPDVVFAPVLAFDRKGGRLGQGGGHYDRTLANLRARKRVVVIGVAYAGQELPEIPMEPHDQRLDAILTETAFIRVARES